MSAGVISAVDDRINPIVVKELRQAVQSRLVVLVLLIFLGVQVLILGGWLGFSDAAQVGDVADYQLGRGVFRALQFILLGTCSVLIPVYVGFRMGSERGGATVDLFYISALRPVSIISGKVFSASLLVLLVFSACAPFLTFTYLLRGLDIPTILLVMAVDLLASLGAVQFAVLLGSLPVTWLFRIILALIGLLALLYLFAATFAMTMLMIESPPPGGYDSWMLWGAIGTAALGWVGLIGLLFSWSVSLVSPPSSNRVLPLRLYVLVAWAVGLVIASTWAVFEPRTVPFTLWAMLTVPFLCLQLAISVNERESWAPRVARTIPRSLLLRPFAFLLYTGSAGGVLFCLGLLALTLGIAAIVPAIPAFWKHENWEDTALAGTFLGVLYAVAYLLAGMALRRLLTLGRPTLLPFTWLFGALLFGMGCTVPFIVVYALSSDPWRVLTDYPGLAITNPFSGVWEMIYRQNGGDGIYFFFASLAVGAAAGGTFIVNLPFFVLQMLRFHPPARPAVLEKAA